MIVLSKTKYILIVLWLLFSVGQVSHAQENENFVIKDITALPGQIVSGKLIIEEGVDEGSWSRKRNWTPSLARVSMADAVSGRMDLAAGTMISL